MLSRLDPGGGAPKSLLVMSPSFGEPNGAMGWSFAGREEESRRLHAAYASVAAMFGAASFNAGAVCRAGAVDGSHPDPDGQKALGTALTPPLRELLGR